MKRALILALYFAATGFLVGCQCNGEEDDGNDSSSSTGQLSAPTANGFFALERSPIRMTPQEMSNQIFKIFGQRYGYYQYTEDDGTPAEHPGMFFDELSYTLAPQLGGIDHVRTEEFDATPKVQTLLAARMLANRIAAVAIDYAREGTSWTAGKNIFYFADVTKDRPYSGDLNSDEQIANQNWHAQVDDLYWQLFSRAPHPEEIASIRTTFLNILDATGSIPDAWTAILYVLLTTLEFWSY